MATTPTASRSRIFISYRREDTEHAVGRLADDLRKHFAAEQVFEDIASIEPGTDFSDAVQHGLETCAAVLVIIGPRWLTIADRQGRRRLDLPDDWVAHEVAESLKQPEVRVFPLLVDADMPGSEELPKSLQPLARRQAFPLTTRHWPNDVAALIAFLKKVPGLSAAPSVAGTSEAAPAVRAVQGAPQTAAARHPLPETSLDSHQPGSAEAISEQTKTETEADTAISNSPQLLPVEGGVDGPEPPARVPWKAVAAVGMVLAILVLVFSLSNVVGQRSAENLPTTRDVNPAPREAAPAVAKASAGETFRDCDQCPEMVVLPAGTFQMGSPAQEEGRDSDEGPLHKVTIARAFAIGKYEVTFDEWDACVAAGGCQYQSEVEFWGRGRHPVSGGVKWEAAESYLSWLSKKTGKSYRLPSEAEWEYSARAGTTTRYPWGDDAGKGHVNLSSSPQVAPAPVGSFEPNGFGLHDMIGNVWEWVQDCYHDTYDGAPLDGRAWESGDCSRRVMRGGSSLGRAVDGRAASREGVRLDSFLSFDLGFRVAMLPSSDGR